MHCVGCGGPFDKNWTHCPQCGRLKSLMKPLSAEDVDRIFEKMVGNAKQSLEKKAEPSLLVAYSSGVRSQVFEVIVRQAIAGAPWREMCAGPMAVNKISEQEVIDEAARRGKLLGSASEKAIEDEKLKDDSSRSLGVLNSPTMRIDGLYKKLESFLDKALEDEQQKKYSRKLLAELKDIMFAVNQMEGLANMRHSESFLQSDLERERQRSQKPLPLPDTGGGPHRVDW